MANIGNIVGKLAVDSTAWTSGMDSARSGTHKFAEDQKKSFAEGQRVTEKFLTSRERFQREQEKLNQLLNSGAISQQTYSRALNSAAKQLPQVQSAIARKNQALQEGKAITERYLTAQEKVANETAKLNHLLNSGAISQKTYNLAMADATKKLPQLQSGMQKFTAVTNAMSVAGGIALERIFRKLMAVAPAVINLASDAAESRSKFNVVFGDMADEAEKFTNSLASSVGRSKNEMIDFAAGLQDTFQPLGFASDEAFKLTKQVQALSLDLASFNNISDGEAIERMTGALIGNHENVRKFGVIITEATLKAELMSMGIDTATRAATEQEKVQARLNMIIKGTSAAQGDAVRTADGYANQLKRFQGAVKDLGADVGTVFLGTLATGLKTLTPMLESMSTAIVSVIQTSVDMATQFGSEMPNSINNTGDAAKNFVGTVGGIADVFAFLGAAWHGLQALITRGLALSSGAFELFGKSIEAIVNLIPGMNVDLSSTFEAIRQDLTKLANEQSAKADGFFDSELPSKKFAANYQAALDKVKPVTFAENVVTAVESTAATVAEISSASMSDGFKSALAGISGSSVDLNANLGITAESKVASSEKGEGPRSLMKGSAEFFRAINSEHAQEPLKVAKQQVDQQVKTNSLLTDLIDLSRTPNLQLLGLGN